MTLHFQICFGRKQFLAMAIVAIVVMPMACVDDSPKKGVKIGTRPLPLVDVSKLKFETPELKKRFDSIDVSATEFAKGDFDHWSYGGKGNNVIAVWAKGVALGEDRCRLRGPIDELKLFHRIHVVVIRVPPTAPVNGTCLRVEFVAPRPEDWCVDLWYEERLPPNNGYLLVKFFRWDPAKYSIMSFYPDEQFKERIDLPISRYTVSATTVELPSELSLKDRFVRYVKSAHALREACVVDLAELQKRVTALINAHKVQKKVYGEPDGGRPPPFHLEPLSPDEEQAALVRAKRSFAAQEELIRTHHKEMYEALRKSFPLERCWPELAGRQ
jgi:hypothetical protein